MHCCSLLVCSVCSFFGLLSFALMWTTALVFSRHCLVEFVLLGRIRLVVLYRRFCVTWLDSCLSVTRLCCAPDYVWPVMFLSVNRVSFDTDLRLDCLSPELLLLFYFDPFDSFLVFQLLPLSFVSWFESWLSAPFRLFMCCRNLILIAFVLLSYPRFVLLS